MAQELARANPGNTEFQLRSLSACQDLEALFERQRRLPEWEEMLDEEVVILRNFARLHPQDSDFRTLQIIATNKLGQIAFWRGDLTMAERLMVQALADAEENLQAEPEEPQEPAKRSSAAASVR